MCWRRCVRGGCLDPGRAAPSRPPAAARLSGCVCPIKPLKLSVSASLSPRLRKPGGPPAPRPVPPPRQDRGRRRPPRLGASSAFGSANGQLTRGPNRGPHSNRARSGSHWLRPPELRPGASTPASVPRTRQLIGPPALTSPPPGPARLGPRPSSPRRIRVCGAGIRRRGSRADRTAPVGRPGGWRE